MLIGLSRVSCLALSKARVRQRLRRPRPAAAILHLQSAGARARPRKTASLINRRANDLAVPIGSLTYIGTGRRPRSDSLRRSRHPIAFLTVDCPKVVYELTYALRDILVERIDGRYAAFRRYEIIESSHKSACRKIVAYFPQRAPLQPEPFQRPLVQQISIIAVEWSVDLNVYCSTFVHELPWAALSIHIKSKTFVSRQVARRLWNTVPGKVGWRTGNDTTTACKANRYTVRFRHAADAKSRDRTDRHDHISGRLIVSAPASFGSKHVAVHASGFLKKHPHVEISFHLTDQLPSLHAALVASIVGLQTSIGVTIIGSRPSGRTKCISRSTMELSDITLFGIPLWKWLLIFALAYGAREAYRGWAENRRQRKEREEARRRFEGKNDSKNSLSDLN